LDIASWLRSLGLEQYEDAFRKNRIGQDILTSLTAEDLRDLGVTVVGDRRRLLDAIAALREGARSAADPSTAICRATRSPIADRMRKE
jgi:hypothetical protein